MVYVLTGIIICIYVIWLALEIKNAPDDPNEKRNEDPTHRFRQTERKKPVKFAKPRKAYVRNPKQTYEDPVFKASEVTFYQPDYDRVQPIVSIKKENGKRLREGYIEAIRYLTVDGKELIEFTCSPTSDFKSALFRILVEAECVEKLTQKRTIKQENLV